jgi:hypothetical protein
MIALIISITILGTIRTYAGSEGYARRRLRRGVEVRVLGAAAARSSSYIFDHRSFRGWRDDSATRPAGSKGWLAGKEEGRSHRPEEEEEGRGGEAELLVITRARGERRPEGLHAQSNGRALGRPFSISQN